MRTRGMIMIIATLMAVGAYALPDQADVEVSLQRYEPFPAEPGTYVDVYLLVSNNVGIAEGLQVELVEEYPFTLPPGISKKKTIGNLDALRETYAVVQYRVNIAPDAINKDYNLTAYSSTGDGKSKVKWEFPVTVKGSDASVTLDSYTLDPKQVRPGETAELVLTLKNTGRGNVKDLDVTLNLQGQQITTLGSGTTKRINRLGPEESAQIPFTLMVDGSAPIKLVEVPVQLQFRDYLNTAFNRTSSLGLVVQARPEVGARIDGSDIKQIGVPGEVSIQVVNSGVVDVRYVNLNLMESPDYELLSYTDEVYIGNLDSDDFEIAQFKIRPLVDDPELKLGLKFKDPYNQDFSTTHQLRLRILTDEELGVENGGWMPLILMLVLGIGAIVGYRAYKARRHKKKA